jgi:hypothetical protein
MGLYLRDKNSGAIIYETYSGFIDLHGNTVTISKEFIPNFVPYWCQKGDIFTRQHFTGATFKLVEINIRDTGVYALLRNEVSMNSLRVTLEELASDFNFAV